MQLPVTQSKAERNRQMMSTNEVWSTDRRVVNINLRWQHFMEGPECQILNVGVSACFVKQRWTTEGKNAGRHH